MKMKFLLKALTIGTLTSATSINVVSCIDSDSQLGLPLAVSNALGLTKSNTPNAQLVITDDNNWTIDLSSVSLGSLLQDSNDEAQPKVGCEEFIKNVLKIQPDKANLYNRAKLKALDQFTTIDNINPIISVNENNNDYDLVSGLFTIQFKKNSNTNLGDEYFVALKMIPGFVNNILISSFRNNPLSLDDFNIDKNKFKIGQLVADLDLKISDKITLKNSKNDQKLNSIANLLNQKIEFTISEINKSSTHWELMNYIKLKISFNKVTIKNWELRLNPSV